MKVFSSHFDILGTEPSLYYQKKQRFFTGFGFFTSNLSIILILTWGLYLFIEFLKGNKPILIKVKEQVKVDSRFNITTNNFFYQIIDENGEEIDSRVIETIPVLWKVTEEGNTAEYLNETSCNKENYLKQGVHIHTKYSNYKYKCISRNNKDGITLNYSWSQLNDNFINIYVAKCRNTTTNNNHCYPPNEIQKKIEKLQIYFNFYGETTYLDHFNRNTPLSSSLFHDKLPIKSDFINLYAYYYTKLIYETDNGYFFPKEQIEESFSINISPKQFIYKEKQVWYKETLSIVQFSINNKYINRYYRYYEKIHTFIAEISGIIHLLIGIFRIITKVITKPIMFVNFVELAEKKSGENKKTNRINAIKFYQKAITSSFSLQNFPLTNTSGIMQAQDLMPEDVGRKKYKKIGYSESVFYFCLRKSYKGKYIRQCEKIVKNALNVAYLIKWYLEEDSIAKAREFSIANQSNNKEFIDSLNLSAINPIKPKKIVFFERNKSVMDSSGIILKSKKF